VVKDDYHKQMPTMEIEKQLKRMVRKKSDAEDGNMDQENSDSEDDDDEDDKEWSPPIPNYRFPERSRLAEAFFGPDAETLAGAAALARRIQVINDLAALCKLREPPCRQKLFNWNMADAESGSGAHETDKMDLDGGQDEPEKSILLKVLRLFLVASVSSCVCFQLRTFQLRSVSLRLLFAHLRIYKQAPARS
jgi:hypothetical protein